MNPTYHNMDKSAIQVWICPKNLEIAIGRGKKKYDKRDVIRRRDVDKIIARAMKR